MKDVLCMNTYRKYIFCTTVLRNLDVRWVRMWSDRVQRERRVGQRKSSERKARSQRSEERERWPRALPCSAKDHARAASLLQNPITFIAAHAGVYCNVSAQYFTCFP